MSNTFHPSDKSSLAMFWRSHDAIADRNAAFMELLNHPTNPLTSVDIVRLYLRNPARYGAYIGFADPADLVALSSR